MLRLFLASPLPHVPRSVAAVTTRLPLLLLAGCALASPPRAAPEPGARRELVVPRRRSCDMDRCTAHVVVGEQRFVVKSRTRVVSPEKVSGRGQRSALSRLAGAVGGAVLNQLPVVTTATELSVGIGTRTVAAPDPGPGAGLQFTCEFAWVLRERRERGGGAVQDEAQAEVQAERMRLAEGLACRATAPGPDSGAVRWHFQRGFTPTGDALAAAVDSALAMAARPDARPAARPMVLERRAGPDLPAEQYTIARDSAGAEPADGTAPQGTAAWRWLVRRPDGRAVGALVPRLLPVAAVDVFPGATDEEAAVLRLLSACLVEPIE